MIASGTRFCENRYVFVRIMILVLQLYNYPAHVTAAELSWYVWNGDHSLLFLL